MQEREENRQATVTTANIAKSKMATGQAVLGMSVRLLRSTAIARIARTSGHDFVFLDRQHGTFGIETICEIAEACSLVGVTPLVRVRSVDDDCVPSLLDNGVQGIVFPNVESREDARRAVEICRFPPLGRRSVTSSYPEFDYRPTPPTLTVPVLERELLVVVMVESASGLDNLEGIAAVEGVDAVLIGISDLLTDLGIPGQIGSPVVDDAVDRLLAATSGGDVHAGLGGVRDPNEQLRRIEQGIRFLTTQSDVGFLVSSATDWVDTVRNGTPSAR